MNSELPPISAAPAVSPAPEPIAPLPHSAGGAPPPKPAAKPYRWLLLGCGGLIALLLVVILSVVITIWWLGRPIKPVVLSEKEKQTVDQKLNYLQDGTKSTPGGQLRVEDLSDDKAKPEPDRLYLAGSKELRLTEREINGLLNENTELGDTVRLEFGRDAINAYVTTPIPDDVPVMGGKMFRARGRFRISIGNGGEPYAILEDVTVFGLSLPKDWLGGIKGENLLEDAVGSHNGKPAFRGIKSLRVEPGAIVIKVED